MSKLALLWIGLQALSQAQPMIGLFTNHSNVGEAEGSVEFDGAKNAYKIAGGGANIWGATDAFHYVWKQVSGDITLSADNAFIGEGKNPHRKTVLMVRQSLDAGSPYADVAVHGDGMISLQYRTQPNQATRELRSTITGPGATVRLERHGDQFHLIVTKPGIDPDELPNLTTVVMKDPVYVGVGISSHEATVTESTLVSNIKLEVTPRTRIRSKLSIYDMSSRKTEVIYSADRVFEAPNWSPDGAYLMINAGGDLYKIPPAGGELQKLALTEKIISNNDHGITKDGGTIAISGRGQGTGSQVYLANADGSKARLVASGVPSYFHGFSPDGKWFAYTGERAGNFDLYRMDVEGGVEERLTSHKALDDGPDYSPDGKWIYMNSERSGHNQIWRIPADGGGDNDAWVQRVTDGALCDWFPHPSPNSKWIVMISFPKGTRGHPPNRQAQLRLMPMPGGDKIKKVEPMTIVTLFGGQGTINVNSWSADSKKFAFVSYERVPDTKPN